MRGECSGSPEFPATFSALGVAAGRQGFLLARSLPLQQRANIDILAAPRFAP
jgi:hypothetical protein